MYEAIIGQWLNVALVYLVIFHSVNALEVNIIYHPWNFYVYHSFYMTHFLQKFLERSSFLLLAIFILSSLNKCKAIKILRLALKLTWIDKYALFPFDIRSILVVDYYRSANRFHPDIRPRILYGISFTRTHYIEQTD